MAQVAFEGLPDYSIPGGTIAGTLVLEADDIVRTTDLVLYLHGSETSQITVQAGKATQTIVQRAPFLELVSSFHDALPFKDSDHIGAGTYRFPFQFVLPANAQPSLATVELGRTRGRFDKHQDGMFVEYELEARLTVPWWIDPFDREVVPVFSPRRVLGSLPPFSTQAGPDHPTVQISVDPGAILPGTVLTGHYSIDNPRLKDLPRLSISLFRHVEYNAQSHSHVSESPQFNTTLDLGARSPHHEGTFQIPLPNTSEMTGPYTGQLYRTYWVARVELEVSLGFNVKVDAVFTPA